MIDRAQYLVALYVAEHRESPPVSPRAVAELLDRTPATAVEVFHDFDEAGLVKYEPYRGVELTEEGATRAEELHETYVTLSWFFRSVLGLDEYEQEAMELTGVLSPDVARRLAGLLPYDGPDREERRPLSEEQNG
jgi:DtxR family Mn-dependent transcriptional regulator